MKNYKGIVGIIVFWLLIFALVQYLSIQKTIETSLTKSGAIAQGIVFYGAFVLIYLAIQVSFAHLEFLRKRKHRKSIRKAEKITGRHEKKTFEASVSIIIPAYNEEPDILYSCIDSCRKQNIVDLEVLVIDDGSVNRQILIDEVYSKFDEDSKVQVFYQENRGKRHAQKLGFDHASKALIVTVDSDTIIHDSEGVLKLIQPLENEKVGAVTGDVRVENRNVNLVSKLISYRYWVAFNQERAAQSLCSVVMCCSGPFSVYRAEIIEEVKDKYIDQKFLGSYCTYGDDRHLTNLVLSRDWQVEYNPFAEAFTYVPTSLSAYIKQQVRWNRSFYREMLWTLPFIYKKNIYLLYELFMQFILPICLLLTLIYMLILTSYQSTFIYLNSYLEILILIALLRSLYGIYRTKDLGFILFIIYGFIHITILVPVRLYSFLTLKSIRWGTR